MGTEPFPRLPMKRHIHLLVLQLMSQGNAHVTCCHVCHVPLTPPPLDHLSRSAQSVFFLLGDLHLWLPDPENITTGRYGELCEPEREGACYQ
jgi:hypothetical protein